MKAATLISSLFTYVSDKLDSTADLIENIPFLGEYLSSPFYFLADIFDSISDAFLDISDWMDESIDAFNGLPDWTDVLTALRGHFEVLRYSVADLIALIIEKLPDLPDWLPGSLEEFIELIIENLPDIPTIEDIINWVAEAFESILDKLFEEGK